MDSQTIQNALDNTQTSPDLIVLIAMVCVGLVLWSSGAKIAKVLCACSGLLAGAAAAVALTPKGSELSIVLITTAVGSLCGIVLGLLLFRLWIAISCAAVFAALAPAVAILWQTHVGPLPQITLPQSNPVVGYSQLASTDLPQLMDNDDNQDEQWWQQTRLWVKQQIRQVRQTWSDLDQRPRWMTGIGTFVAALIGLAIGLIGPNIAAAAQSSVIGSFLILIGSEQILFMCVSDPPAWWPASAQARIITFTVVTAMGIGIQMFITRKSDDS